MFSSLIEWIRSNLNTGLAVVAGLAVIISALLRPQWWGDRALGILIGVAVTVVALAIVGLSDNQVPTWLRVAASLELGMIELADKLAKTIPSEEPILYQWVQDARLRIPPGTGRTTALVLSVDQKSMTENWKPSTRHGALVSTVNDFGSLLETLRKFDISKPADFPFDRVLVELAGDRATLGRLVVMKPVSAISFLTPSKTLPKDLDLFLGLPNMNYFGPESPLVSPSAGSVNSLLILAPKELDRLIETSLGTRLPPPPGQSQSS